MMRYIRKGVAMGVDAYLWNFLAVMALMMLGWVVSLARNNVTHVDTLWGLGFILIAWLSWGQHEGTAGRRLLIPVLTTLWGVRLAVYMHWRSHGKGEDPRYARWRQATGDGFWMVSLFKVFLLQAVVLWIIALVVQVGTAGAVPHRLGVLEAIGLSVWLLGFGFETIGDWQLARFKADPANAGRVMDRGLWRYTRHPNYFGECLVWWGLYLIVLSEPAHWWTVISPRADHLWCC